MPKRTWKFMVYDAGRGNDVGIEMEVEGPEFLLDVLESKALTDQILAQEAYDSRATGREVNIRAKIIVRDRSGRRKR
jgi:hypothetical protein